MFRYMPFSSGVSSQITEVDNEDRFRRLTIRSGRAVFEIPLATELIPEFMTFMEVLHHEPS